MDEFENIYRTYFKDVYLYVRSISGNEAVAEDITAETFFKAMKSLDCFKGTCDIRVWLCQIAKNCYVSYLRKNKKQEGLDSIFKKNENWACVTYHRARSRVKEKNGGSG